MTDINSLVFEALQYIEEVFKPSKRFKTKMLRKTRQTQQHVFAGQTAAHLARKKNPSLDARKAFYRKMYLALKQREQQMYGSRAKSLSRLR